MVQEKENKTEELNRYWEHLGIVTGTLSQAVGFIKLCFETGDVPCLIGEAGTGKTQVFGQIAQSMNARIHYMFLAHKQPEDFGIPMPNEHKTAYRYLCEEALIDLMQETGPVILVLDEWNRGDRPVMNAAFTMMEHRRFGSIDLPPNIFVAAAMNPSEGNYLVNEAEKDPAFRRRLCFFGVRTDPVVWLDYARGRGAFHPIVTEFIQTRPDMLTDVRSRESGKIYANPAAWEKVSNTLKFLDREGRAYSDYTTVLRFKFAGHLGDGTAGLFLEYLKEQSVVVSPTDTIMDYSKVRDKIRRLVKQANFAAIDGLIESVVVTAVSNELPPEEISDNFIAFCEDLPDDKARALLTKIVTQSDSAGKSEYRTKLNKHLARQPRWGKVYGRIKESEKRGADEARAEEKSNP